MLTISDLISVLALCATFYSLGYTHGKHNYQAIRIGGSTSY